MVSDLPEESCDDAMKLRLLWPRFALFAMLS
jgi:hypothetical protein